MIRRLLSTLLTRVTTDVDALRAENAHLSAMCEHYQHESTALERLHDRAVAERDRLRALLTAAPVTTSPTTTTDGKPLPCPFCGSTDVDARTIAYVRCMTCEASGPTWPDDAGAVELWNTRAALSDSTTSPAPSVDSGAEPTVEEGAFAGQRACWDCRHDSEGDGTGMCHLSGIRDRRPLVADWIRNNCTDKPLPGARNCPGWAPKSGEVSDG